MKFDLPTAQAQFVDAAIIWAQAFVPSLIGIDEQSAGLPTADDAWINLHRAGAILAWEHAKADAEVLPPGGYDDHTVDAMLQGARG